MSIGVGILGFAHGHVYSYCTQWRKSSAYDIQIVAGWDHDASRLAAACKETGAAPCASVDALLARADVEAVIVASETVWHCELVEQAAAAGKTIVLQKPMALTLPEADRMVAAVQRAGVPFTLAWQMRTDLQNVRIKELLASGEFGKVLQVRRRHGLGMQTWPNLAQLWHVDPALNRDMWADDAAHAIDFIHWLLGMPESVTAEIDTLLDPIVPMDNGIAIYRYPGGPLAEVVCSFTCLAAEDTTEVVAEKGTIIQNYGDGPSCNVPRVLENPGLKWYKAETGSWTASGIPSPSGHSVRIAGLAAPLAEFLQGRRAPIATAEDGRDTLRMTLACHLSTREGRRVRLDDPAIARV